MAAGYAHQSFRMTLSPASQEWGFPEFVSHEQFGRVDHRARGDQVRVRRDAGDPGSAGCELVVQHQFVRRETRTLSAPPSAAMTAMNFLSITLTLTLTSALCGTGASGSDIGGA
jgi:hypothetical protein